MPIASTTVYSARNQGTLTEFQLNHMNILLSYSFAVASLSVEVCGELVPRICQSCTDDKVELGICKHGTVPLPHSSELEHESL